MPSWPPVSASAVAIRLLIELRVAKMRQGRGNGHKGFLRKRKTLQSSGEKQMIVELGATYVRNGNKGTVARLLIAL
jgi:hypothetical protein